MHARLICQQRHPATMVQVIARDKNLTRNGLAHALVCKAQEAVAGFRSGYGPPAFAHNATPGSTRHTTQMFHWSRPARRCPAIHPAQSACVRKTMPCPSSHPSPTQMTVHALLPASAASAGPMLPAGLRLSLDPDHRLPIPCHNARVTKRVTDVLPDLLLRLPKS